ncbi:unnamed protein product, partial [Protopolystoma xenopodis]
MSCLEKSLLETVDSEAQIDRAVSSINLASTAKTIVSSTNSFLGSSYNVSSFSPAPSNVSSLGNTSATTTAVSHGVSGLSLSSDKPECMPLLSLLVENTTPPLQLGEEARDPKEPSYLSASATAANSPITKMSRPTESNLMDLPNRPDQEGLISVVGVSGAMEASGLDIQCSQRRGAPLGDRSIEYNYRQIGAPVEIDSTRPGNFHSASYYGFHVIDAYSRSPADRPLQSQDSGYQGPDPALSGYSASYPETSGIRETNYSCANLYTVTCPPTEECPSASGCLPEAETRIHSLRQPQQQHSRQGTLSHLHQREQAHTQSDVGPQTAVNCLQESRQTNFVNLLETEKSGSHTAYPPNQPLSTCLAAIPFIPAYTAHHSIQPHSVQLTQESGSDHRLSTKEANFPPSGHLQAGRASPPHNFVLESHLTVGPL